MLNDIFAIATKEDLRFKVAQGTINCIQLWNLKDNALRELLDNLWTEIQEFSSIENAPHKNKVTQKSPEEILIQHKYNTAKYILDYRVELQKQREEKANREIGNQPILKELEARRNKELEEALSSMTEEQLLEALNNDSKLPLK